MAGCEKVNPYRHDSRGKAEQVEEMFDNIAPAYDFMNRAMTMGIDRRWRRKAVRTLPTGADTRILDIATGTGDLAMLVHRVTGSRHITGVDLSAGMIEIARQKAERENLSDVMEFIKADSLALPFADNTFNAVTVAYGVRNFADLLAGYREMFRVLKPGGVLAVLELSTPESPLVLPFYRFYTRRIIPAVGRMVSHDVRAYSYLPESIASVPQGTDMLRLITEAGFSSARCRKLTFGVCSLYTAVKP